jgi:hypothetical protein
MLLRPILNHTMLYPACNNMLVALDLETQEVVSYKYLPQEHHEGMRSAHPIDKGTIL